MSRAIAIYNSTHRRTITLSILSSRNGEQQAFIGDDPIYMERMQPSEGENIEVTFDHFTLKHQMMIACHVYATANAEERANGFELFRGNQRCEQDGKALNTPRPDGNFFWTD